MEHQDLLDRIHRLHFIGIGGSGMCPMAEILHKEGFSLTGSDIFRVRHSSADPSLWDSGIYRAQGGEY